VTVVALAAGLSSARAVAAEPTAAEIAVARRLFQEATELKEQKKWQQAAERFREAIKIKETPGLRFHLADTEEQLGHLVEAQVEYDRAGELIRLGAKAPDVESLLGPARESLRERIPTVTVRVPAGVTDAVLEVDRAKVSAALIGQPIPLNPGAHSIQVGASGRRPFALELALKEGDDRVVEADLPPQGAQGATTPAPEPASQRFKVDTGPDTADSAGFGAREAVLITEGVLTVAAAGLGVFFYLEKSDAEDRITDAGSALDSLAQMEGVPEDSTCTAPQTSALAAADCRALAEAYDDRDSAGTLSTIAFVGAGVGAVAFVTTWLLWDDRPGRSQAFRVGVAPSAGGFVSQVRGEF
jgi:hypothetical protein